MHRYSPRWSATDDADTGPNLDDYTFRDARDVIEYAADDRLTTWYTYPWLWHLDDRGTARCFSKGSSLCDIQRFAEEPDIVLAPRQFSRRASCPPFWIIIESRKNWRRLGTDVTEADVAAFIDLRKTLAKHGIALLDDIVVNEQFEWWSLHELSSGTTAWDFTPPRAGSRHDLPSSGASRGRRRPRPDTKS